MPLFRKGGGHGYDLDLELSFYEAEGVRYGLGSAGSFIMICPKCGAEHFRDRHGEEHCFEARHGALVPYRLEDREKYFPLWEKNGRITTVDERKAMRLEREKKPHCIMFGDKTEADFPSGYVSEN